MDITYIQWRAARLPGRCARLVSVRRSSGVARSRSLGGGFLRRDVGRGAGQARHCRKSIKHRPGLAVHGRRVITGLLIRGNRDQHGRARCMRDNGLRRAAGRSRQHTRRCIAGPTMAVSEALASMAAISTSTTPPPHSSLDRRTPINLLTRAAPAHPHGSLTTADAPTYRRGKTVQTTGGHLISSKGRKLSQLVAAEDLIQLRS